MRQNGFTLIELVVVVAIVSVLAALTLPSIVSARAVAGEGDAVSALRQISNAQSIYQLMDKNGDGAINFAETLPDLVGAGLLDPTFTDTERQGYLYTVTVNGPDRSDWSCVAVPAHPKAGTKRFFVDSSGVIRFTMSGTPDASSKPIG